MSLLKHVKQKSAEDKEAKRAIQFPRGEKNEPAVAERIVAVEADEGEGIVLDVPAPIRKRRRKVSFRRNKQDVQGE